MTIAECLGKINALDSSKGKLEEQKRVTAVLLANRDYLSSLLENGLSSIPPMFLGMISKLMPKNLEREKWVEIPISGIYNMSKEDFATFFDMLTLIVDYARGTTQNEHITET
ncbi:MAG: hypothetical protein QXI12_06675 [Candidatus Methanomethyliaceae archaeon]